jgi:hypothetical protein
MDWQGTCGQVSLYQEFCCAVTGADISRQRVLLFDARFFLPGFGDAKKMLEPSERAPFVHRMQGAALSL